MLSVITIADSAYAQNLEPTLEDEIISARSNKANADILTLSSENDLYASGRDENYTNGVRLSYFNADFDLPAWARRFGEIYPGFRLNDTTALTYSIGQNLYTPSDITIEAEQPDDRPWAAWLYGSVGLVTITDNHMDELEIALGVVGPAAGGKMVQRFVHNYISGSDEPRGWGNQIKNELGVVVSWERRWPQYLSQRIGEGLFFSASPHIGTSLGNIYTHAEGGVSFRLSPYNDRFADLPARVRPAMPGTGYYPSPEDGWSWAVFAGATGRLVGRNIFLDGNTFRDNSPSVDKEAFVYDLDVGADLIMGENRLSYTVVRRSKEFEGQENTSVFGAVTLSRRF